MAWNTGLTKETDARIAKYAKKVSKSIKKLYEIDSSYRTRTTDPMHTKEAILKMKKTKTGTKLTENHKKNIKKALYRPEINVKLSVWSKMKLPPNLKIAQSKSPVAQRGEKNIRWNPNYQDVYGYEFTRKLKNEILNRDERKCKVCKSARRLVIHHKNENKHDNLKNNLITLCRTCHMKVHHKTLELSAYVAVDKLDYMLEHPVNSNA